MSVLLLLLLLLKTARSIPMAAVLIRYSELIRSCDGMI